MSLFRPVSASLLAVSLLLPEAAGARSAEDAAHRAPHAAPGGGPRRMSPDAKLPASRMQALPKPSAAERAEQKKLEHDLRICIGC